MRQPPPHPSQVVLEPVRIYLDRTRECGPRPRTIAVAQRLEANGCEDTPRRPRARIDQRRRRNAVALLQVRLEHVQRFRIIWEPLELPGEPCEPPRDQRLVDIPAPT